MSPSKQKGEWKILRVDTEVHNAILKEGLGIQDTFNKVLRRKFGLDKPKKNNTSRKDTYERIREKQNRRAAD